MIQSISHGRALNALHIAKMAERRRNMDMLYTVLLADLSMVLVCYAILLLAFASNVVLSLYHNINIDVYKRQGLDSG